MNIKNLLTNQYFKSYRLEGESANTIEITVDKLDTNAAPELDREFRVYWSNNVDQILGGTSHKINMTQVKYLDSSGLSSLVAINEASKAKNGNNKTIELYNCNSGVYRVLEISSLKDTFKITPKYDQN